jgi:hypothetical protein
MGSLGLKSVSQLVQVDDLVKRAPQTFDKDIVHTSTPSIYGDCDLRVHENASEVIAGELASLIGIGGVRLVVSGQRLSKDLNAEGTFHGVLQSPHEDVAGCLVHDRDQVKEATLNRGVCGVGTPDMIGSHDLQFSQQIRINPVFRMRGTLVPDKPPVGPSIA